MFGYVVSGVTVASDLALPGLIERAAGTAQAAVTITAGDVPVSLPDAAATGPNWALAGDRFLIDIPGIVAMLLTGGTALVYRLAPGVKAADAAIFVSGTGFGILLHQRRRVVLHASAVRVGHGAMLFAGASGAGKSTLAAALVARGHALLADDLCAVTLDAGAPPLVHPDGRQLKLWQNSIDRLALADRRIGPVRTRLHKYYVEPAAVADAPLPVIALYVLREADARHPPGIARLNIVDSALLVRGNAYRPGLVRNMEQADLYLRAAAGIAAAGGVFHLTRRLDFAQMDAVAAQLARHWDMPRLKERAA